MGAFLRRKGQILWDVTVDTGYVQPMDFLAPGSRDRFDANNKAVDYLFHALCQLEVWCSAAFSGRKVVCWFLGPVALQWLRGLGQLG
jgi:hypothetical protein